MEFICINLKDFHSNQKGVETVARIVFIEAADQEKAEKFIQTLHPETAWFVLPKRYCDKHIAYCKSMQ